MNESSREHVGIDNGRAVLSEQRRDAGFAAADVSRESNENHVGLIQGNPREPAWSAKLPGAQSGVNANFAHGARDG
jgi:hypothetical protein